LKKIAVITTYPENGTQNIGDQLITDSLISILKKQQPNSEVMSFWREESYTNIKEKIESASAVVFACLAIRPNFAKEEYPYIEDVIESGIPIYIISSGTSLDVSGITDLDSYLNDRSKEVLRKLDDKAVHFGIRGALSYKFLKNMGLKNIQHTGDVAFYSESYLGKKFEKPKKVNNIVISDPHRAIAYRKSFLELIKQLKTNFPLAELTVALHGKNEVIESLCLKEGIRFSSIYRDKKAGLEIYDNADLHIGYRVHAHVSTLKRRKISYLLEQDGRGCDYGLSLPVKLTVPNYQRLLSEVDYNFVFDLVRYKSKQLLKQAPITDVKIMMSLLMLDYEIGFSKFTNLDVAIDQVCDTIFDALDGI